MVLTRSDIARAKTFYDFSACKEEENIRKYLELGFMNISSQGIDVLGTMVENCKWYLPMDISANAS